MSPVRALLVGAAALLSVGAAPGGRAPHLTIHSVAQLPQPLPAPYDASANADAQVAGALRRARAAHKMLLVDFGANWCADCRALAGVLDLPELKPWLSKRFELVSVDIGRFDRNLGIARRFGVKLEAVPSVLVIDPTTGRMRNAGNALALGDAKTMTPQAIADWLARWTH